eukprot:2948641-Pleurochrysis_carterae.AAC.1
MCFSTPPERLARERASSRDVHDTAAQGKKHLRRQGLGEEVGQVVCAVDKRHGDVVLFDTFADEEVSAIDMFGALVVLWIVRQVNRRLVVHGQGLRLVGLQAEVGEQRSQIYCLFRRLGGGDNFCLAISTTTRLRPGWPGCTWPGCT